MAVMNSFNLSLKFKTIILKAGCSAFQCRL